MNKQLIVLVSLIFSLAISLPIVMAVPASPAVHNVTQPDGTSIQLIIRGDEYSHWIETVDGYSAKLGDDGWWVYDTGSSEAHVTSAYDYKVGKISTETLSIEKHIHDDKIVDRFKIPPVSIEAVTGDEEVLVLLVDFSDKSHDTSHSTDDYKEMLFDDTGDSMRNYFEEVSYDKLHLSGFVSKWYTVPDKLKDYNTATKGVNRSLIEDIINLSDDDIDYSEYDKNGDDVIDHIIVIAAGCNQASDTSCDDTNGFWPIHQGVDWCTDGSGDYCGINVDGVDFEVFSILTEDTNMGTFAHEFGHDLGLPDLYDTDQSSAGVGYWDLMSSGNYLDPPGHISAWSKAQLGWLTPTNVTSSAIYTISSVESNPKAYKIAISSNEYLLIENREKEGFDKSIPGQGLMIWHIDDSVANNNNEAHKRVDVEEASGAISIFTQNMDTTGFGGNSGDADDPWFYSCFFILCHQSYFMDYTTPDSKDYSGKEHYVQVIDTSPPGSTMSATFIVPRTLSVPDVTIGAVQQGKSWETKMNVNSVNKLKVTLNWINSDQLTLKLTDPSGATWSTTTPRSTDGLNVTNPRNGVWTIQINGTSVSNGFTKFTVSSRSLPKDIITNSSNNTTGGINFTDINLNYVSTCSETGDGFVFAVKGTPAGAGDVVLNLSSEMDHAMDDFMTGLVIPNYKQWITMDLIPDGFGWYTGSVERIDPIFRQTETARVMLDADEKLKVNQFSSPEQRKLDKEMRNYWINDIKSGPYWSYLKSKGYNSMPQGIMRTWIYPDYFVVNGTDCNIFIEKSHMNVSIVFDGISLSNLDSYGLKADAVTYLEDRLENYMNVYLQRHRSEVTSITLDEVNNDPKYEQLRRAYASLALAQWYKKQDRTKMPFGNKIDSENITGLYSSPPFNMEYWNQHALQYLYSQNDVCGFYGGTCTWTAYGGVMLAGISPEVIDDLDEQISSLMSDAVSNGFSEKDDEYYIGGSIQTEEPDLRSNAMWFSSENPSTEDIVNISFIVRNDGMNPAGRFKFSLYDDFTYPSGLRSVKLVKEQTIDILASNEVRTFDVQWNSSSIGVHSIYASIDSGNSVRESNERNNAISRNITISTPYPEAFISYPLNGDVFSEGQKVSFSGYGIDPQDGLLVNESVKWSSSLDGDLGKGNDIEVSSLSDGTHVITLTVTDSDDHSKNIAIGLVVNPPGYPSARIESPRAKSFAEGEMIYFSGRGYDPEDGALSGDSIIWTSDLDGEIGKGSLLNVRNLTVGNHSIEMTVTDSSGLPSSTSVSFEVFEGTPLADIAYPENNTQAFYGYAVTFKGNGSDPQDGILSGDSLIWSSDIDGYLGTGEEINVSTLSEGVHKIRMTSVDSHGLQFSDEIVLTVNPTGYPIAFVTSPRNGERFVHGDDIYFKGSGLDAEDGALSGDVLVWSSNRDGVIGKGSNLTKTDLSVGDHTITLTATNSRGKKTYLMLSINVTSRPPAVFITSPASGEIIQKDTSITFDGYADDLEDGSIPSSSLAWTSSLDGKIGSGKSFATSKLSVGTHKITLAAVDSHGVNNTTIINIVVAAPGNITTNIFSDGSTENNLKMPTSGGKKTIYLKIIKSSTVELAKLNITGLENNDVMSIVSEESASESEETEEIPEFVEPDAPPAPEFNLGYESGSDNETAETPINESDENSTDVIKDLSDDSMSIMGGSDCTESGYSSCYEYTNSYGGATAHARIAYNMPSRNYTIINGSWRPYVLNAYTMQHYCLGDQMTYDVGVSVLPSCDSGGCPGDSTSLIGTYDIATAPASKIPSFNMQCWDKDKHGGSWATAWVAYGPFSEMNNFYVLKCADDSQCSGGKICDKSGSWDTWDCVIPNKPTNPKMDASADGDYEWSYSGIYYTTQRTNDFSKELQTYIDTKCTSNICLVPVVFSSTSKGTLKISDLDLRYKVHDTDSPVINSLIAPDSVETGKSIAISLNATDNTELSNAKAYFNGAEYSMAYDNATGLYKVTITAPSTAGIYDLKVRATDIVGLYSEQSKSIKVYSLIPDLSIASDGIKYSPSSPLSGDAVSIDAAVNNYGNKSASFDIELKVDGASVEKKSVSLASSSNSTFGFSWTAVQGNHTIKIVLDPSNAVKESNELNNDATANLYARDTEPPKVNSLEYKKAVYLGETIRVKANVTDNVGIKSVVAVLNSSYALAYNSSSGLYEADVTVNTTSVTSVNVIATDVDGLTAGKSGEIIVYGLEPDLEIKPSDIKYEGELSAGKDAKINVTVRNNGKTKVDDAKVKLSVAAAVMEKNLSIPAGSQATAEFAWKAEYGMQNITASVDPDNSVTESNELNNNASKGIFVRDLEPPIISDIEYSPSMLHDGDAVDVSARVSDNVGVKSVNGELGGEDFVMALEGSYYKGTVSAPAKGDYLLTVSAADISGIKSQAQSPVAVYSRNPDLIIESDDVSIYPKAPSDLDASNVSVSISNTGESDADDFDVDLVIDGKTVDRQRISVDKGLAADITLVWNATYGNHTLAILADSTGRISEDNESNNEYDSAMYVVDITPPPAPILNDDVKNWSSQKKHTVYWDPVTDVNGIDHYEYMTDYGSWEDLGSSTSFETSDLEDGMHVISVRAVDNPGNLGELGEIKVYVDDSVPNAPYAYESHCGGDVTAHGSPYYSWDNPGDTGSGVVSYIVEFDGKTSEISDSYYHPNASSGEHTFKVKAKDAVGHESEWSNDISVKTDITPPKPPKIESTTHPSQTEYYTDRMPKFVLTPSEDDSGIYGYYYLIDSSDDSVPNTYAIWTNDTEFDASAFTTVMQQVNNTSIVLGLADGTWYLHIVAMDNLGNMGTEASHYRVNIESASLESAEGEFAYSMHGITVPVSDDVVMSQDLKPSDGSYVQNAPEELKVGPMASPTGMATLDGDVSLLDALIALIMVALILAFLKPRKKKAVRKKAAKKKSDRRKR